MTHEEINQMRSILREEIAAEGKVMRQEMNARFDAVGRTLAQSQEEFGELLRDILDTVSTHHTKLADRVERIEEHLGLPKPH